MTSTISNTRSSASNIEPIIVMLSDMEMAGIFSCIVVAMANEICLPMVVEEGIGNCYPFRGVSDVD
jgi:hypothetical protein